MKVLNESIITSSNKGNAVNQKSHGVKKAAGDILCFDVKETIRRATCEIMAIKRILERKGSGEKYVISQLENYFEKIYENSPANAIRKFESHKAKAKIDKKNNKGLYAGINKDSISHHLIDNDFNLLKLIIIHNGLHKLKIKEQEVSLIKAHPGIIKTKDIDRFYRKNIKGTSFDKVFMRLFGNKKKYLELIKAGFNGNNDFNADESKIILHRGIQNKTAYHNPLKGSFENFSLNLIFSPEEFDEIVGKDCGGISHELSVINFIKLRETEQETFDAVIHEKTHGIYDAFFGDHNLENTSFFNIKILEIVKLKKSGGKDHEISKIAASLEKQINAYLGSATPEIIADFEKMKSRKISTAFGSYHILIEQLTAIFNAVELDGQLTKSDKDEVRNLIQNVVSKSIERYKAIYRHLADFIYISEMENRSDELFSLLIIYGISKYEKIEGHLKELIGKEKYESYKIIRSIIRPQYFRLPKQDVGDKRDELFYVIFNLPRTKREHEIGVLPNPLGFENLEYLLGNEIPAYFLDKNNRNLIVNSFTREDFKDTFALNNIEDEDDIIRYVRLFNSLLKKMGIDHDGRDYVLEKILEDFENYEEGLQAIDK